ncbi:hypothetical protein, partial [Pararhodobacter oceanensis]
CFLLLNHPNNLRLSKTALSHMFAPSWLSKLYIKVRDLAGGRSLCVPYPDAGEVMNSLTDIKHILAAQSPSSLDRIARERGFYATEAARWHGARIAELVARFPRSG